MTYSDAYLRGILSRTRTIACIGVSTNPIRPSHFVWRYLSYRGYRIVPVNPMAAGQTLFGETVLADLSEIPATVPVDMIDIFRRSEAVPEIYADARRHLPGLRTVWMQIGVEHADVAAQAEAEGLDVVQNRCPKMEYQRVFGELRKAGINTGIISSRLPEEFRHSGG